MRHLTRRSPLTTGSALFLVVATLLFVVSCGGSNPSGPSKSATAQEFDPGVFNPTANTHNVPGGTCIAAAQANANVNGSVANIAPNSNINIDGTSSSQNNCDVNASHPRTCIALAGSAIDVNGPVSNLGPNSNIIIRSDADSQNNC